MAPRPSLAIGQGREQVSGALKAEFLGGPPRRKGLLVSVPSTPWQTCWKRIRIQHSAALAREHTESSLDITSSKDLSELHSRSNMAQQARPERAVTGKNREKDQPEERSLPEIGRASCRERATISG